MSKHNRSIAGLMGCVLWVGLGLAALRSPIVLWGRTIFMLTGLALLVATVAALLRPRPPLVGFVVFAWGYLVFGLMTETLAKPLPNLLIPEAYIIQQGNVNTGPSTNLTSRTGTMKMPSAYLCGNYFLSKNRDFVQFASSLLCIASGLMGTFVGQILAVRDRSH